MTSIHQMEELNLKHHKETFLSWNPSFDFSIVQKLVYCKTHTGYECGYIVAVFIGIDDSIQLFMGETNPFGDLYGDEGVQACDASEDYAKSQMKSMDEAIDTDYECFI